MSQDVPPSSDHETVERRFSVCIQTLIRHTKQGIAPESIYFRMSKDSEEKDDFYDRFESTEAFHEKDKQSRYVFHTELNENELSNCLIKICDDEFSENSEFISLMRDGTEVKEDKEFTFRIGKFKHIWFRELTLEDDTKKYEIIQTVLGGPKPDPDTAETHDVIRKEFEKDPNARELLQAKVIIVPEEAINMYSIDELLLKGAVNSKEKHRTHLKEIYGKLEFDHFRSSLRSADAASDLFDNALADLREQFVHKLPTDASGSDFKRMTRTFDLTILRMFNMKGNDGSGDPMYVVFDDNQDTLDFVEVTCGEGRLKETADKVYERSCGLPTDSLGIQKAVRENWIKYQCLHGQDEEFNIFRSLCFAPTSGVNERYQIGLMALTLQILLCFGITVDSFEKWEGTTFEDVWNSVSSLEYEIDEVLIVAISALAFGFILQRLRKTVTSFNRFYRNMKEVCVIPKAIIILDFSSNIIVGTWMAAVTPFLLLKSEDIQTVVLNSFALTIFVELDDLANIFESDEPFLLKEDANGMRGDNVELREGVVPKRKIGGKLTFYESLKMVVTFLLSPLYELCRIIESMCNILSCCCGTSEHPRPTLQNVVVPDGVQETMDLQIKAERKDASQDVNPERAPLQESVSRKQE